MFYRRNKNTGGVPQKRIIIQVQCVECKTERITAVQHTTYGQSDTYLIRCKACFRDTVHTPFPTPPLFPAPYEDAAHYAPALVAGAFILVAPPPTTNTITGSNRRPGWRRASYSRARTRGSDALPQKRPALQKR